jgi:hypothetical protein
MPSPRRRKSVQLRKQKKIKRIRYTEIILVDSGKVIKRFGVKTQELHRRREREKLKRDYITKGKLSKENRKLLSYVKKYKAGVAKKYNRELVKVLKEKGWFKQEINWAKKYSLVGKNVEIARANINVEKYNKANTKGKINGKWYTKKQISAKYKRAVKKARLGSYMDILGVTKEKAKKILNIIDKKLPGVNELKALIY